MKYTIVVEGSGKIYDGESEAEAKRRFKKFVELFKQQQSNGTPRSITMFKDYKIVKQYPPDRAEPSF